MGIGKLLHKEARIFLLFMGFVILLSIGAFKLTAIFNQNLEKVFTVESTKERLLNEQITILDERRLLLRDIILTNDPFDRDELIQRHATGARNFLILRNQLLEFSVTPTELAVFNRQVDINRKSYQAQLDFVEQLAQGDLEDPVATLFNVVVPLLAETRDNVVAQRDQIIIVSGETRRQAQGQYELGWMLVLVLYIFSLIFTGIMAMWVYSRQKKYNVALEYQATHDALTGLTNRSGFEQQLHDALEDSHLNKTHNAVLYLDLDQFKIVNDTSGHTAGDELLKDITHHMRRCIRGSDLLARIGGDEFGVLLCDCGEEKAVQIAENIRQAVADYRFVWSGQDFSLGVSIGLVVLNDFFRSVTEVLSAVDVACYTAKDLGRNRVHVYTEDDTESSIRHSELHRVSQIRKALSSNHFRLYYQKIHPMIENNESTKVEILLRLERDGLLITPDEFIPAAERFNLMPHIDRWVTQHTLTLISASEHNCLTDTDTVCINLSGASIADASFLSFLIEAIDSTDLGGKRLCFEITESAAIAKLTRAVNFMSRMRERGCQFSLDDFGKGLSSYTYLKQLPVDYIKIDGSFVCDMQLGSVDYEFVQSINTVGKALGLKTVAEWVETEETLLLLKAMGVDYAQGRWLSQVEPCHGAEIKLALPTG